MSLGGIVPVIDLKAGQVVRAVGGRRSEYRSVDSCLARGAAPGAIARAFVEQYGFRTAYVADLDALAGAEPDWETLDAIAQAGLELLVDVGLTEPVRAAAVCRRLLSAGWLAGAIVGLESIGDPASLRHFADLLGPARALFSVDLLNGRPLAAHAAWRFRTPAEIAAIAVAAGYRRLIVLDLATVGTRQGPTSATICRSIREADSQLELLAGGGARDMSDVRLLHAAGCDAVLVSSALHDGGIRAEDVAQWLAGGKR